MLVSFLIASASAGPTITNRCGVDGTVPHSFLVTLKSLHSSNRRSTSTSAGSSLHSSNRRSTSTSAGLDSEDKLSFLHAWVQQYNPVEATSNGTRRKLEASTHAVHYFTQTQLAVAVEAGDDVIIAHTIIAHTIIAHTDPPTQTIALMAKDPAVSSIEVDCLQRADMLLPESNDSSPGAHDTTSDLYEVGRKLSVQVGAPWGIDRIDTNGRPIDNNYDDGDLTGKGVRVYIVDTGVQGSHDDFGGRVVNGHTVRAH